MSRIYLNPEMDNDFFYNNLKASFLLYDEIIIWQPVEFRLQEKNVNVEDFLALLDPIQLDGRTVYPIRPAGRELFFDYVSRLSDRAEWKRRDTSSFIKDIEFRSLVSPYAERAKAIAVANGLLDSSDTSEEWRQRAIQIFDNMRIAKKVDMALKMNEYAEDRNIDNIRANFQEFLMDSFAISDLSRRNGFDDLKLMADLDHWRAYNLIDRDDDRILDEPDYLRDAIQTKDIDIISSDPQVRMFFDHFYNAEKIPIGELIKFKQSHYKEIRKFIDSQVNSIRSGSLIKDSYIKMDGIYGNIREFAGANFTIASSIAKNANTILKSAGVEVADISSELMQAISGMIDAKIFNNSLVLSGYFDFPIRKYLIKFQINQTRVASAAARVLGKEYIPHLNLLIDSVGFDKKFLQYQINKEAAGAKPKNTGTPV